MSFSFWISESETHLAFESRELNFLSNATLISVIRMRSVCWSVRVARLNYKAVDPRTKTLKDAGESQPFSNARLIGIEPIIRNRRFVNADLIDWVN